MRDLETICNLSLDIPSATFAEKPVEAPPGFFRIRTVAAQIKSRANVSRQMQATAAEIANSRNPDAQEGTQASDGEHGAGALLLVSGGHPVRRLPIVRNFLPTDAVAMLQEGRQLRERDLLPKGGWVFARVLYIYIQVFVWSLCRDGSERPVRQKADAVEEVFSCL